MMRLPPRTILCPTDMSTLSQIAVRCGLAWAVQFGAKAFVLMARELSLPPRYFTRDQIVTLTRQADEAEAAVRADLETWVKELGAEDVPFEAVVGPGPADRAILRAVKVVKPDLVVMGTHGRSGYNRFLMGSTTEKVIREIPVPLLVIREGCRRLVREGAAGTRIDIRRILCAAQDPELAGGSLPSVTELARRFGAEVTLLHSLETPGWLNGVSPAVREEAVRRLAEHVAAHAADIRTKIVVREGPAYQRILEQAREEGADLIVVGGRRPGGEYPVFGSTAVRVMRHARCPVLALPGQG